MNFIALIKKTLSVSICLAIVAFAFSNEANAQENRERVVKPKKQTTKSRPTTQVPASPKSKRRTLTNEIVVRPKISPESLVRKTSKSQIRIVKKKKAKPTKYEVIRVENKKAYSATRRSMMLNSIKRKIGVPYRLGTQGPRRYDCSGFVWKVFQESGMPFTRTSARQFWRTFKPVYGNDRFEFGTLVFLNRLGHVGIVADKNGFYHASSSRGVMYSKFAGYWSKRIVGYRRVPKSYSVWNNKNRD